MKDIKFIIHMHDAEDGKFTVDNYFTINDEEKTYGDISTEEKYNVCMALKQSLGLLAKMTMIEMEDQQEDEQQ